MLTLRHRILSDWIDSAGRSRAAVEPLAPLVLLDPDQVEGFVAWEIGVVTDDRPSTPYFKPLVQSADAEFEHLARALEPHEVLAFGEQLQPIWVSLLEILGVGRVATVLAVRDQFWSAASGWIGAPAFFRGRQAPWLAGAYVDLDSATVAAAADLESATRVIRGWWPTMAGYFAIALGRAHSTSSQLLRALPEWRRHSHPKPDISCVAITSSSFHNAGFCVLSDQDTWQQQAAALEHLGWRDGTLVSDVVGDRQEE